MAMQMVSMQMDGKAMKMAMQPAVMATAVAMARDAFHNEVMV